MNRIAKVHNQNAFCSLVLREGTFFVFYEMVLHFSAIL